MDHIIFFLLMMIPIIVILFIERKNIKKYVLLGLFAVILASVWEPIGVHFGLWSYSTNPQFFGVSVITLMTYFQYVCISYFLAELFSGRIRK